MKVWFAPKDLAGLPGMPGTSRGVIKRAEREQWESRRRDRGPGRPGLEYHMDSLPAKTQAHLSAQSPDHLREQGDQGDSLVTRLQEAQDLLLKAMAILVDVKKELNR